jgi:hypothetical protein
MAAGPLPTAPALSDGGVPASCLLCSALDGNYCGGDANTTAAAAEAAAAAAAAAAAERLRPLLRAILRGVGAVGGGGGMGGTAAAAKLWDAMKLIRFEKGGGACHSLVQMGKSGNEVYCFPCF